MNVAKNNINAILLAGGKSSRMGTDKGLLLLNNKPMLQHVIDAVQPLVDEIIIVSNQKEYEQFGFPVFEDSIKDAGPLAGIYTGLQSSKMHKNVVLSCDVPYVSEQLIAFLIQQSANFDATIPRKENMEHPLIGVYTKNCLSIFQEELANRQLKLRIAIENVRLNIVDVKDFDAFNFLNINTKEDLNSKK